MIVAMICPVPDQSSNPSLELLTHPISLYPDFQTCLCPRIPVNLAPVSSKKTIQPSELLGIKSLYLPVVWHSLKLTSQATGNFLTTGLLFSSRSVLVITFTTPANLSMNVSGCKYPFIIFPTSINIH